MKTRTRKLLRTLFTLSLTATLFVSCGKKNTSGSSSSNSGSYTYPGTAGGVGAQGMQLPSNWLQIVMNENPCQQNGQSNQRQRVVIPVPQSNINAGSFFVGITAEGDVAIASNVSMPTAKA